MDLGNYLIPPLNNLILEYVGYFMYAHYGIVTPYMLKRGEFPIPLEENLSPPAMSYLHRLSQLEDNLSAGVFSTQTLSNVLQWKFDWYVKMMFVDCPGRDPESADDAKAITEHVRSLMEDRSWLLKEVTDLAIYELSNYECDDREIFNLLNGIFSLSTLAYVSSDDLILIASCYGDVIGWKREDMISLILRTQENILDELSSKGTWCNKHSRVCAKIVVSFS